MTKKEIEEYKELLAVLNEIQDYICKLRECDECPCATLDEGYGHGCTFSALINRIETEIEVTEIYEGEEQ